MATKQWSERKIFNR